MVARPRRFDQVIKLETIPAEARRAYLATKVLNFGPDELEKWVEKTDGLSFAALAELVISVFSWSTSG